MYAFTSNASPYGSFAEAKQTGSDRIYVKGALDKESIHTDVKAGGKTTFFLTDLKGEKEQVQLNVPRPENLGDASDVVVIGGFQGSTFVAKDIRVKCPSRYEDKKGAK